MSMDLTIEFGVPDHIMYEALTEEREYMRFTQTQCKFDKAGEFSIFDGNIHGTVVNLDPPKTITLKWAFREWGDNLSDVVITISGRGGGECSVNVNQTNIPPKDARGNGIEPAHIKEGWK